MDLMDCRIGRTPWFIAYDTKYDSIVISIRGTWSIKDVVTDILAGSYWGSVIFIDEQSLEEAGKEYGFNGENEYTHRVLIRRKLLL